MLINRLILCLFLIAILQHGDQSLAYSTSAKLPELTCSAGASPTNGPAPLTVSFTGNVSGGGEYASFRYSWNFGDGASSSSQNPAHVYTVPGTYNAVLVVEDTYSNESCNAGVTITVSPPLDRTPPTITIASPVAVQSVAAGSQLIIRWTSTDNVRVTSQDLLLSLDGGTSFSALATNLAGDVQTFTWNVPNRVVQRARIRVIARDAESNVAQMDSPEFSITDQTPPTVSLVSLVGGETLAAGSDFTIQWSSSDNIGIASQEIYFSSNGGNSYTAQNASLTAQAQSWRWSVPNIVTVKARIRVVVSDAAGLKAQTESANFTIADRTSPTVSITSPAQGAEVKETIQITVSVDDNIGVTGVQYVLDGTNFGQEITSPPFSLTLDTTKLSDGPHRLQAIARDAAGNRAASDEITFTVKNPPPVTIRRGDMNQDGTVDIKDLIALIQHLLGASLLTGDALRAADLTGDNVVDVNDLIRLIQVLLGVVKL